MADAPILRLAIDNPTLDSAALLIELADHIGVPGETEVLTDRYPHSIRIETGVGNVYVPPVDWDTLEDDQ